MKSFAIRRLLTAVVLLVFVVALGPAIARAEAVKDLPKPTNYVSDFANVLTPETKQQINQLCAQVDHQAHAQIAVVTIKTLDDVPIQDFSVQLWDSWKIGQKDRGVLILLAVQDHKRWITTGYGLESILPDSRVGDIGRQMVPYLRSGDYDDAASLAVGQISQIIARDAGVTLQQPLQGRGPPRRQAVRLSLGQLLVFAVVIFLVILFLARAGGSGLLGFLLGMFLGGRGGGWGGGGGGGGGDGGFGGFGGGSTGGGGAGGDW
ncbi:MAG TPA: TPM domain-containing protein [Alloacidobacterium sp.]|nr:TPM domain-containing protein [Alloacidobacterium sp.]